MALSVCRRVVVLVHRLISSSSPGSLAASLQNEAAMDARRGLCDINIHFVSKKKLSRRSNIVRPYPRSPHLFYQAHYNPRIAKLLDDQFFFVNAEFQILGAFLKPFIPVKCLASTRGWVGLLNADDGSLHLHRPALDEYIKDDVRLPAVPLFPFMMGGSEYMGFQVFGGMPVRNLVLSAEPDEESCILMAVLDEFNSKLAFCRPGLDGREWTILHGSNPGGEQLVYSEARTTFYTLSDCFGGIEGWNFSDPRSPSKSQFIYKSIPLPPALCESEKLLRINCKNKSYLVVDETSGDLLLVVKYYDYDKPIHVPVMVAKFRENGYEEEVFKYGAQRYDVYKVDFAGESLKYLNCLTDRVIFLCFNHSFCLTTNQHPHLIPHTIYFADDYPEEYDHGNYPHVKHLAGIYHYAKHGIGPFPPFQPPKSIREPTFWVAPGSSEKPELFQCPWRCNLDEEVKKEMIVRPYPTSPHLFYPTHVNPLIAKILDDKFHYTNAEFVSFAGHSKPFSPVKCLASTRGWLGLLKPNDGSLHLHRPHLDGYVKDDVRLPALPLIHSVTGVPEHMGFQVLNRMSATNLVLSAEPDVDSCIVMAVLDESNPKLAYCRPARDGSEWTILHDSNPGGEQLVYSESQVTFYALSACSGGIEAWNFCDPSNPKKSQFVYESIPFPPELSESEKLLRENCKNKMLVKDALDPYIGRHAQQRLKIGRCEAQQFFETIRRSKC